MQALGMQAFDNVYKVWYLTHRRYGYSMNTTKVRKQFILESEKLAAVKRLFEAKTDTEAINKAMDMVIENARLKKALEAVKGKGKIKDVYGRNGV